MVDSDSASRDDARVGGGSVGALVGVGLVGPGNIPPTATLGLRAKRPDFTMPRMVMSAAQAVVAAESHSPHSPHSPHVMLRERLSAAHSHDTTPPPVSPRLGTSDLHSAHHRTLSAPRSPAAFSHRRRPSQLYGSSKLASVSTLDGPLFVPRVVTPLDSVPSLFPTEALAAFASERPYLQDIQAISDTLVDITRETNAHLDRPDEAGQQNNPDLKPLARNIVVPNVADGWSGNRRQVVSETVMQLSQAIDKLLVDPYTGASGGDGGDVASPSSRSTRDPASAGMGALSNLRYEFLSSREILSLIHEHAHRPSDLAPSLLALSKMYQNRLLEFQGMDELRLEIEPVEQPKPPRSARDEKRAKAQKESKAPKLWGIVRKKSRLGKLGRRAASTTATTAATTASSSDTASLPLVDPELKWRRLENQGSLDMYLPWNLVRREMHLFAPEMVELTKIYWRACFMDERGVVHTGAIARPLWRTRIGVDAMMSAPSEAYSEGGLLLGLPKKTYMHLFTLIHYVLKPSYLPSYAQQVVAADWLTDTHMTDRPKDASRVLMTLPQFTLGLFNLVDVWTEGVALEEYVLFLKNMFEFITEEVAPPADFRLAPRPKGEPPSLLDDSDSDSDEHGAATSGGAPTAAPVVSSVYHRRLKPLTIEHINNLRKLGARASSFRALDIEMLREIEEKSRFAAALAVDAVDSAEAQRRMTSSDSTAALTDAGEGVKSYRPRALSVSRRVEVKPPPPTPQLEIQTDQDATPPIIRTPRRVVTPRPVAAASTPVAALSASSEEAHRSSTESLTRASALIPLPPSIPPTPSPRSTSRPRSPPSPLMQPIAPALSWGETDDHKSASPSSPSSSSEQSHRRQSSSEGVQEAATSDTPHVASPSTSHMVAQRLTDAQMNEETRRVDISATEFDATLSVEFASDGTAVRVAHDSLSSPVSPLKAAPGRLSWRMPGGMDAEEAERLLREDFREMQREHEELKRTAVERRQRREAQMRQRLIDEAEEDDDEFDEEEDEDPRRPRGSSKRTSSPRRLSLMARASIVEEKEQASRRHSLTAVRGSRNNSIIGAHPRMGGGSARRPWTGGGAAHDKTFPDPMNLPAFDAQRRRFAAESAAYLAQLQRLETDVSYHTHANHARLVDPQGPRATPTLATVKMQPDGILRVLNANATQSPNGRPSSATSMAAIDRPSSAASMATFGRPSFVASMAGVPRSATAVEQVMSEFLAAHGGGAVAAAARASPSDASYATPYPPSTPSRAPPRHWGPHAPAPLFDGFTPTAFFASPSALPGGASSLPTSERASSVAASSSSPNRRLLIARTTPSGDKRDRFWRLMPQGRIEAARAPDPPPTASATTPRRPAPPPPAHEACIARITTSGPHSSSRYCECAECVALLGNAPTTAGNGARTRAAAIHAMLQQQMRPDKRLARLDGIMARC